MTTKEKIEKALEALEDKDEYGFILRAKGIVEAEDGQWIHFDYVPGEQNIRYGSAGVTGRLCVIGSKLVKRGIELTAVKWGEPQAATGQSVRLFATIVDGIDKETASKISKDIRNLKLKCKATIEGDKLRVSSASRDTLQEVIAFLKGQDYGQPLQYTNYR